MTVQKNREKLVNNLVGNIILSDDGRVVITFKYSEDPVTTTVAEIEEMSKRLRSDVKGVGSPKEQTGCLHPVCSFDYSLWEPMQAAS